MSSYIFLLSIVSSPAAMLFNASSASSRTDDVYDISCDADIGDGKDGN